MGKLIFSLFKALLCIFLICIACLVIVSFIQSIPNSFIAMILGTILIVVYIILVLYFYYGKSDDI